MIRFTQGNLLEAEVDALVNTVNTVGVMGKGVALMFKEAFPDNYELYAKACSREDVRVGKMFVTRRSDLYGPKWIINFPTKSHWRSPSKISWISDGLDDLRNVIDANSIRSIALPPLGAGNGGLDWKDVRTLIVNKLDSLTDVDVLVYEPTKRYQNVAKRKGVLRLTPSRALVAELVRRYSILGIEYSVLEVQKLAYFLDRFVNIQGIPSLNFEFSANRYGPYSDNLRHLLDALDGSYLHCDKRLSDAGPFEPISFVDSQRERVAAYFTTEEAKPYRSALEATSQLIDGFESPLGMELLATVDWLIERENVAPNVDAIRLRLEQWPGGKGSAERKLSLFEGRIINIAIEALAERSLASL